MPFYAIFEGTIHPTESSRSQSFYETLEPYLRKQHGLIEEINYYNEKATDSMLLSSWTSETALITWQTLPVHLRIQQAAREGVFASYRIRVGIEAEGDGEIDNGLSSTRSTSGPGRVMVLYQRPIATISPTKPNFSEDSGELKKGLLMEDCDETALLKEMLDYSIWLTQTDVLHVSGWPGVASAEAFEHSLKRVAGDWLRRIIVVRDYTKVDRKEAPAKTEPSLSGPPQ